MRAEEDTPPPAFERKRGERMADKETNGQYMLEMLDITKEFPGVKALDGVKLQVAPSSVHALMGENGAGKSTLMKCLFGIYRKDAGRIIYRGEEVNFENPKHALMEGISMVHQELNQVLERSVMENIFLGRYPTRFGIVVDDKKMYNETKAIFDDLGNGVLREKGDKWSKVSVGDVTGWAYNKYLGYQDWYDGTGKTILVALRDNTPIYGENYADEGDYPLFTTVKKGTVIADQYDQIEGYYVLKTAHDFLFIKKGDVEVRTR